MLLRVQRPEMARPFKIPFYPLPPLIAMGDSSPAGQPQPCAGGLAIAMGIGVLGTLIYIVRARRLRQWPFADEKQQ